MQLDTGKIVRIPVRLLEPREPESKNDVEVEDAPETQHEAPVAAAESVQMPSVSSLDDPTCSQATPGWISGIQVRQLATSYKPDARSGLRAISSASWQTKKTRLNESMRFTLKWTSVTSSWTANPHHFRWLKLGKTRTTFASIPKEECVNEAFHTRTADMRVPAGP